MTAYPSVAPPSESRAGAGRRISAVVLDVVIGALVIGVLFAVLANKQTGDTSGLDGISLRILGDKHWFYITRGDSVWDVHDGTFWALLAGAVGWVILFLFVLRAMDTFTPGRLLMGVRGKRAAAPAGPGAMPQAAPGAPGAPQWDPARGTYIQWDPTRNVWLQWNPAHQQWTPIA